MLLFTTQLQVQPALTSLIDPRRLRDSDVGGPLSSVHISLVHLNCSVIEFQGRPSCEVGAKRSSTPARARKRSMSCSNNGTLGSDSRGKQGSGEWELVRAEGCLRLNGFCEVANGALHACQVVEYREGELNGHGGQMSVAWFPTLDANCALSHQGPPMGACMGRPGSEI